MARVRGMGVALIISKCGSSLRMGAAFCRSARRCGHAKAVLLVDHRQRQVARTAPAPESPHACPPPGPPRRWRCIASIGGALFLLLRPRQPGHLHAQRGQQTGSSQPTSLAKCCSARISVGAISAHCQPASMRCSAASAATTVLPAPTSPCSSRCMGWGAGHVGGDFFGTTRCCAAVRAKGSAASNWLTMAACRAVGGKARRGQAERSCLRLVLRELLRQQLLGLEALPGRVAVVLQGIAGPPAGWGWCKNKSASRRSNKGFKAFSSQ